MPSNTVRTDARSTAPFVAPQVEIEFEDLGTSPEVEEPKSPVTPEDSPETLDLNPDIDENEKVDEIDIPDFEVKQEENENEGEGGDEEDTEEESPPPVAEKTSVQDDELRLALKETQERLAAMERKEAERALEIEKREREAKIEGLKTRLLAAKEEGDAKAEVDLQVEIATLANKPYETRIPDTTPTGTMQQGTVTVTGRKAQRYAARHAWIGDPAYSKENQILLGASQMLAARGLDPETDEYYDALDKHLAIEIPHLVKGKRQRRKSKTGGVAGVDRGNTSTPSIGGTDREAVIIAKLKKGALPKLTRDQIENMRRFKLDPNNPQHKRQYQLNVRADMIAEYERKRSEG